jgi:hypothetical protein
MVSSSPSNKAKRKFRVTAMLLFYIPQKLSFKTVAHFPVTSVKGKGKSKVVPVFN